MVNCSNSRHGAYYAFYLSKSPTSVETFVGLGDALGGKYVFSPPRRSLPTLEADSAELPPHYRVTLSKTERTPWFLAIATHAFGGLLAKEIDRHIWFCTGALVDEGPAWFTDTARSERQKYFHPLSELIKSCRLMSRYRIPGLSASNR